MHVPDPHSAFSNPVLDATAESTIPVTTMTNPQASTGREPGWPEGLAALVFIAVGVFSGFWFRRDAARNSFMGISPDFPAGQSRFLADFQLTNSLGQSIRRQQFSNKLVVVNFVFTSCGASCLLVSRRMAELQRLIGETSEIRLLSITIDPKSDTPKALEAFSRRIGAHPEGWDFLTGDAKTVNEWIDSSFWQGFAVEERDPYIAIQSTTRIALVNRQGVVLGFWDGMKPSAAGELYKALQAMQREGH